MAQKTFLESLSGEDLKTVLWDWPFWARREQWPPAGDWTSWLLLGGRGAGKTRAGTEWIRMQVFATPPRVYWTPEPFVFTSETGLFAGGQVDLTAYSLVMSID